MEYILRTALILLIVFECQQYCQFVSCTTLDRTELNQSLVARICSPTGSSSGINLTLIQLPFCNYSLDVVASRLNISSHNESKCVQLLGAALTQDSLAMTYFQEFSSSLWNTRCSLDVSYYSPLSTCYDCEAAYSAWVCASVVQSFYISSSGPYFSCNPLCWDMVTSCPPFKTSSTYQPIAIDCPSEESLAAIPDLASASCWISA